MFYIVNNYINNKNDSLSYQPELKLNGEFYTEGFLEPTTLFYINYGLNLATKRVNVENIEEIQFKAPIPRQGILLIGDFMQCSALQRDFNLTIFNNTAISNTVCRVANSTLDYITNCLIVFATTIKCNLQRVLSTFLFRMSRHILSRLIIFVIISILTLVR